MIALRYALVAALFGAAVAVHPAASAAQAATQGAASPPAARLSAEEVKVTAKAHVEIGQVQDSLGAQLAQARNKTPAAQEELRQKLRTQVTAVLGKHGLTDTEFQRRRFLVSTDDSARLVFDSAVAAITGQPLPGRAAPQSAAGAAPPMQAGPPPALPAGPVGVHLGHVVASFGDTPEKAGLLPTALAEARIAAQHAHLALRTPDDLAALKRHAGHVLHALDPAQEASGPGRGYGVKKAATGAAAHVELAARTDGASPNVKAHATHVATAARATVARADQVIALVRQVREAPTAQAAAALMGQVASLADQLIAGADANSDGRITWDTPEGGLQQAEAHATLLLAGEKKP